MQLLLNIVNMLTKLQRITKVPLIRLNKIKIFNHLTHYITYNKLSISLTPKSDKNVMIKIILIVLF